MGAGVIVLTILVLSGCSGSDSASVDDEDDTYVPHQLEGAWTTTGVDERYGEVTVRMRVDPMGELVVTVELAAGGTLRFAGVWSVDEQTLVLTGTYFEPEGQAQATWSVEGDSVMVLQVPDGHQQRWRREN
jgi:hypothetical protein